MLKALKILIASLLLFTSTGSEKPRDINSTLQLVEYILSTRQEDQIETYTFFQETIRYDSVGTVTDTSMWYEAVQYPDNFRIDFGSLYEGRTALFRNDSSYRFSGQSLDTTYYSPQDFMFLESSFVGYDDPQEILQRFEELGYNPGEFHVLPEANAYVIGGNPNDMNQKQVWLNRDHFYMVRSVGILGDGRILDVIYDDFKAFGDFWIETKIEVYIKGKLFQLENYLEIDIHPNIPEGFFDPKHAFEGHWTESR